MFHRWSGYLSTLRFLLYKDLVLFSKGIVGKLIDTAFLVFTTLGIFAYFLPMYGLGKEHGGFMAIGAIAGFSFFEMYGRVTQTVADLNGDREILYTLSLPVPSALVFFYQGVSWGILSMISAFLVFPLAKFLLWSRLDLQNIHLAKTLLMFLLSNLFYGFLCLWLSGIFQRITSLNHLFPRVLHPMFMLGGYCCSFEVVKSFSPVVGAFYLCNPMVYIMEGMRSAILGPEGFLPFSTCVFALIGITALFAFDGIRRMQKRLDCAFSRRSF